MDDDLAPLLNNAVIPDAAKKKSMSCYYYLGATAGSFDNIALKSHALKAWKYLVITYISVAFSLTISVCHTETTI